MSTVLPRPTVDTAVTAEGDTSVVIHRDGKAKSYIAKGATTEAKVKDAVEQVIADHHTAEWLP